MIIIKIIIIVSNNNNTYTHVISCDFMWQFANVAAKSPGCSATMSFAQLPMPVLRLNFSPKALIPGFNCMVMGSSASIAAPFEECVGLMVSTTVSPHVSLDLFGKVMKEVCLAAPSLGFLEPTCLT